MACAIATGPSFHSLDFPTRLAQVKTSPTFTSSDLFTPFSTPRATLPSIGEFVRPSYGKVNTWGTVTATYGGVGYAANYVEESGKGSVSRSHRHFGTGCVNFHAPDQPYSVTELMLSQCRPCDQLLPKPLVTGEVVKRRQREEYPKNGAFTSHVSKFDVFPSGTTSGGSSESQDLTPRTARTLKQLHHGLYCTTTYKEHLKNYVLRKRETGAVPIFSLDKKAQEDVPLNGFYNDDPTSEDDADVDVLAENGKETYQNEVEHETINCGNEYEGKKSDRPLCGCEDGPSFAESAANSDASHVAKDGFIAVTHLPDLPEHFHRITSKYTRNRSTPPWPCYIPFYLYRKHCALPTNITALPEHMLRPKSGQADVQGGSSISPCDLGGSKPSGICMPKVYEKGGRLSQMSHSSMKHSLGAIHEKRNHNTDCKLPSLTTAEPAQTPPRPRSVPGSETSSDIPPLSSLLTPCGSRVPHRLGVRFKTDAHARYHMLYPDQVPDLRDSQMSGKKYFFYDYHASVFRG